MAEEDEIRSIPTDEADLPPPEEEGVPYDVENTSAAVTPEDGVTARPTHPERQPGGPYVEPLSAQPEDLGRRWLQDATQAPPTPESDRRVEEALGGASPEASAVPEPGELNMREMSPDPSGPGDRLVTHMPDASGVEDRRGRRPPEADRDTPYTPDPGLADRRAHLVTETSPGNRPESRLQALFAHKIARGALAGGMLGLGFGFLYRASRRRRRDQA